ncbi:unnamed protein product [Linum trigynum]|uniref:Uncharacterized protein n=1 Tax=Linum trigynum TaxID=586398 RepID=A0AAV2ETH2_9ROSI
MMEHDHALAEVVELQRQVQQTSRETSGGAILSDDPCDILPEAESDETRIRRETDTRVRAVSSGEAVIQHNTNETEPLSETPLFGTDSATQSFLAAMDSPVPTELAISAEHAWVSMGEILGSDPHM